MKKFDGINIIPFVDIMLVLLAIILTTSTLIEKKLLPISLPSANNATKIPPKSITITITKDGKFFWEREATNKKELEDRIKELKKDDAININCDNNASFKEFVYILDKLKSAGLDNIAIVTKENE